MSENILNYDRFPTDPTQAAGLLLLATALISQLTPDQTQTLTAVLGLAGTLAPLLPAGRR